ncbi:MAG: OPT/YSL family transporter [Candidatus Brocadiae bacterium]|nr:OPT/YSL family transporter [Candidatus Brocadiia bacterium]
MTEKKDTASEQKNLSDNINEQMYFPEPDEAQLTVRTLVAGCAIGCVSACTNIYIGLKIGWTFGASIICAVLAYAIFAPTKKKLSVLETNIAQTAGSAAGSMTSAAGLVAAIPAMELLGYQVPWLSLLLWALCTAFLGVFFAVPLKRQLVDVDKLRFPSGMAVAQTILAMKSEKGDAMAKAKVLIWAAILAGLFRLANHFVPTIEMPPLEKWAIGLYSINFYDLGFFMSAMCMFSFKIYLGPSLMGAGFLIGPKVVVSLVIGAIIAWGILGPIAYENNWAPGNVMSYENGVRGWIIWPGVALMVSEAITALALSWKTFIRALKFPAAKANGANTNSEAIPNTASEAIPNSWWLYGLLAGSLLTIFISSIAFDIQWYFGLLAIALSAVLAIVAVRSVGETDINPIGGMGKVTQLVFGIFAPGHTPTNLMSAALTGAGASQAADIMQDLKTGKLLGASAKKQFIAQLIGICTGVVCVVPVYYIFSSAYKIGDEQLPAPAAYAWKAMAELLAKGFDALPPYSVPAVLIATFLGAMIPILKKLQVGEKYLPSGLAMGIAFIIPAYYSFVMLYGLVIWLIWKKIAPKNNEDMTFSLASGLIAGEGLMGIVNAILTMMGITQIPAIQEFGILVPILAFIYAVRSKASWERWLVVIPSLYFLYIGCVSNEAFKILGADRANLISNPSVIGAFIALGSLILLVLACKNQK